MFQSHIQIAREALAGHDLQRASDEYAQILKLDPRNAEIQAAQGVTLYALGKPAEAQKPLESALALDASQVNAEIFLALSRSDLGKCPEAEHLVQKHFNERTEPKLRRLLGLSLLNCYIASSEFDAAVDFSRSLKRSHQDDPDVLYTIAELYSRLSKAAVDELLNAHPDSYRVHQLAGESLEAQGKYAQAALAYRKALELHPRLPRIHYRIGRLILLEGSGPDAERKALDQFQQEIAVNPGDAASRYQIAELFRKQQRLEEARKFFLEALESNRGFVEAHIGLGKVYVARHDADNAIREFQNAIRLRPEEPAAHYALMTTYRDLGRTQEAQREMATFQQLQARKEKDSRAQLRSLLTGQGTEK